MLTYSYPSVCELTQRLEELSAGCDLEFDAEYEELERQFAEMRMTFSHN